MIFNEDIIGRYLSLAPIPLAFERYLEARIYQRHAFQRPILDIGCGDGIFAHVVFGERIDTGIDPNPRELENARATGAYDELIQCTGDAIDKPDGSYNTIYSNSVLEHIPEIVPVFHEAHRLLAAGGRFYVTVPSHRFDEFTVLNQALCAVGLRKLAGRYRSFFNKFWRHYHCYKPEEWSALARRTGFKLNEIHSYGTRSSCLVNDLLAPFSIVSFLVKKLCNRWVLFPGLRHVVMTPVAAAGRKLLERADNAPDGGLVFMELTKT